MKPRLLGVAIVGGALVGLLLDRVHVYAGVLDYAHPVLFGQAWWVPLLFAGAGIGVTTNYQVCRRFLPEAPLPGGLWAAIGWFVAAYLSTAVFADVPWTLLVGLLATWAVSFGLAPTPARFVHALSLAIVGPIVEYCISSTGGFTYRCEIWSGIPVWLPALYLFGADLGRALAIQFGE